MALGAGGVTQPDGIFTLADVAPGTYTLEASIKTDNSPMAESAVMPISVYGDDISGLTIVTARPGTMRGLIVADTGVTRRLPAAIDVSARPIRFGADSAYTSSERNAFELIAPPSPFRLTADPVDGWMVKAIVANGIDVTDSPIDLKGQQGAPVRIVLTDRVTEVSGVAAAGQPGRTPTIVVFPDDHAKRAQPSRYIRTVEAAVDGTFRIVGLPAGERYLAVAVDDLEDGEGDDPDFLARVKGQATPIALAEGEKIALELTVIQR